MATEGAALRLEAIVLAAGLGSRFGGGKLMAEWRGRPLIEGALAVAFAAPVRGVTVVTGADGDRVRQAATAFAETTGATGRLRIVQADRYIEGMGQSLAAGFWTLPKDAQGAFVFLGDMPAVPHEAARQVLAALTPAHAAAAPTFKGQRGHPVLFLAALFPVLKALEGDLGARPVLQGLGERLALVAVDDPGVLIDIDRPEDLAKPS